MELTLAPLYSEAAVAAGMTTDKADLLLASMPLRLLPDAQRPVYQEMARRDAAFYLRLEAAGFTHDFGEDGRRQTPPTDLPRCRVELLIAPIPVYAPASRRT
jgi:cation diffusion facilitator CzcD-associated flavoprotein CzcO